jgi:hypothetical protein
VATRAAPKIPTGLTGAAGEYYTVAELSRRGWLATVTIKNSPGTDVLAQKFEIVRLVAIQTKTASEGNSNFQLGEKDERVSTADEWYVFVLLKGPLERPDFYIVPRNVVAGRVYSTHRDWLSKTTKAGKPHNDNPRRNMSTAELHPWLERWDLLDTPASKVKFLGPRDWREIAAKFRRAEGYPGFGIRASSTS